MKHAIRKAGLLALLFGAAAAAAGATTPVSPSGPLTAVPAAATPTAIPATTPGPSLTGVRLVCADEIRSSRSLGNKSDSDFDDDLAELYDSLRKPPAGGKPAGIRADPAAFSKDEDGRASYLLVSCLIFLVDSQRIGTDITRIAQTWPDIKGELLQGFGPVAVTTTTPVPGAMQCEQAYAMQEAEFADVDRRNPAHQPGIAADSVPVLPGLQVALYMTSQRLLLLDTQCKGQPRYAQYAAIRKQYDNAERACANFTRNTHDCQARLAW